MVNGINSDSFQKHLKFFVLAKRRGVGFLFLQKGGEWLLHIYASPNNTHKRSARKVVCENCENGFYKGFVFKKVSTAHNFIKQRYIDQNMADEEPVCVLPKITEDCKPKCTDQMAKYEVLLIFLPLKSNHHYFLIFC